MFFEDQEESFRASFSDDDREAAKALLATCRPKLTGREECICESIAATESEDCDWEPISQPERRWFAYLKIQFAAEIGQAVREGVA